MALQAFTWRGDPRLGGDRRRPGRAVDVVPPAAARDRPCRAGRRRGTGWGVAAPLGLADHARRARHRGAAGRGTAQRARGTGERGGAGVLRRLRAHPPPAGAAAGPGGRGRRGRRRTARGARRRPRVDYAHAGQCDRHVVTPVHPELSGRRDVPRGPAAHPRLPRPGQVPRPAGGGRRRGRLGGAAAR